MAVTITGYPYDTGAGGQVSEDQWSAMWGSLVPIGGVNGDPIGTQAKVSPGTGLQISVAVGDGFIRGMYFSVPSTQTHAITSNASGSTRHDLVVIRNNTVTNTMQLDVKAGTPGAGVPPLPTWGTGGVYEISLARVQVANGAASIPGGNITDLRGFIDRSTPVYVNTESRDKYNPTPKVNDEAIIGGSAGVEGPLFRYNGSSWRSSRDDLQLFRASMTFGTGNRALVIDGWNLASWDSELTDVGGNFTVAPNTTVYNGATAGLTGGYWTPPWAGEVQMQAHARLQIPTKDAGNANYSEFSIGLWKWNTGTSLWDEVQVGTFIQTPPASLQLEGPSYSSVISVAAGERYTVMVWLSHLGSTKAVWTGDHHTYWSGYYLRRS